MSSIAWAISSREAGSDSKFERSQCTLACRAPSMFLASWTANAIASPWSFNGTDQTPLVCGSAAVGISSRFISRCAILLLGRDDTVHRGSERHTVETLEPDRQDRPDPTRKSRPAEPRCTVSAARNGSVVTSRLVLSHDGHSGSAVGVAEGIDGAFAGLEASRCADDVDHSLDHRDV